MSDNGTVDMMSVSRTGTPLDYSSEMYRVYFEVVEYKGTVRAIFEKLLGSKHVGTLKAQPYGYECALPIQCIPEMAQELAKNNIGVYQIIRHEKTGVLWR